LTIVADLRYTSFHEKQIRESWKNVSFLGAKLRFNFYNDYLEYNLTPCVKDYTFHYRF